MSVQILGSKPATTEGMFFGVGMANYGGLKEYLQGEHPRLAVGILQGVGEAQASLIADALEADLASERFAAYLADFEARQTRLNTPRECTPCEGMGLTEDASAACSHCKGSGFAPMTHPSRYHRLTRNNAEAFAAFLRVCGGFTVGF